MTKLIKQLIKIEQQHPEFFKEKGKCISDYIAAGMYKAGALVHPDLPVEIMDKILKVFNASYEANKDKHIK
ncbi:MAG TPA: hypothetical protein VK835_09695 [Bacteroidia bacterium]|jgi:hypothetical protein|nr:hypothetical protein [Bacteroidia bacterium]